MLFLTHARIFLWISVNSFCEICVCQIFSLNYVRRFKNCFPLLRGKLCPSVVEIYCRPVDETGGVQAQAAYVQGQAANEERPSTRAGEHQGSARCNKGKRRRVCAI